MEGGAIAIILGLVLIIIFIWLPFKAVRLIRDGGLAITEAAQELNNKRLHEAGSMINRGAGILLVLLSISLVLSILSVITSVLAFG